jgi:dolichol-phosphate mannosyltransferase
LNDGRIISEASAPASVPSSVRVLVCTFAYNESTKIQTTVSRILSAVDQDVLVMDDGSSDGSMAPIRHTRATIISNETQRGIGFSMKRALLHALDHRYDVVVIMAGNNKDDPTEIPALLSPIVSEGYDFVQGSRYLKGGRHANMPAYRKLATRLHPWLFSLAVGKWLTESTNGFRAFRTSILRDPRVDWQQPWLDRYELEPYLLFKAIRLGYRHTEVPVTKVYPPKAQGYTKMKPLIGWWSILRPIFFLGLGIKK